MKILLVNKYLYPKGGAETYVFKLGAALSSAGHEVQYFGMADERNIVSNSAGAYAGSIDFHKASLSYLTYPFKIVYSRSTRRQIRRVIEDFKPDIIHLNNFNFQLTPSIIYEAKKHGIPVVYTAHDVQLVCPSHKMTNSAVKGLCRKCMEKGYGQCAKYRCIHSSRIRSVIGTAEGFLYSRLHTYRKIDRIICPSRFMENELLQNMDLAGRTTVLYNFIEEIKPSGGEDGDYVVYFGRYSEEKGIKTLVKAAKSLPDVRFVFAGRGELQDELKKAPNIRDAGFLSGDELNALVEGAMFSVLASEWSENCPFSVMESQTLLTPVLGADIGGIPELIDEGKTGMLFKSGDAEDLKEKIRYLYDNPALCREMSEQCKSISYDTVNEYTYKVIKIYKELLK